ncbi:putative ammonium transporter 1 [Rhopilema esculentum]|uniref:putative ammonium transporter 1 n=1 Tax=Rhopilema esculentum TaxID=499914 RepID=UPI0031CFBEB9
MESLIVLFAFVGYTLLQLGASQPKNTSSIIINNVLSLVISAIMFWATGYAFAFGSSGDSFLSYSQFFLIDATQADFSAWFKHFTYLALYIAIVNGSFAERMRFWIYPFLTVFLSGFVYPVSTHWAWHSQKKGWLMTEFNTSDSKFIVYQDVGGAGVIHVSAGGIAVIAAILLGARPARKSHGERKLKDIGGETNTNIFLGALLVLIGLGTKNVIENTSTLLRSRALVNSFLAASMSGFTSFALKRTAVFGANWNTKTLLNSAIMGLVSVSAAPGNMYPYAAFAIGFVSGCAYVVWSVLLKTCRVDDISDTITVNVGGGILGVLAGPLLTIGDGVFYAGTIKTFNAFGLNMLGLVVFFFWHAAFALVLLAAFVCANRLTYKPHNISHETGFDIHEHDEPAYPAKETFPEGDTSPKSLAVLTDMGEYNFYGKPVRAIVNGSFAETKLDK